ncbi:MAG: hypothetical protein JO060_03395 [Candidatus Eremiobacteraeota bacterium]|nr:hypothetical protein [Candidatus Eremiobacteraeota bacterium]MBV9646518.1 hypothetical protein [Candidatus Eremiobacteraeota bacterium]
MNLLKACAAFCALALALAISAIVFVQCAGLIARNIALSRELAVVRSEVSDLQHKRTEQQRTIRRLHEPAGAVPEIHERLRFVRPKETIIYVKGGQPTSAPPIP